MLRSFIGADMRLYERFGIGLHNNPDDEVTQGINAATMRVSGLEKMC